MNLWSSTFHSVKEVRAVGTSGRSKTAIGGLRADGRAAGPTAGGAEGEDWWDDVSHQAQRVAHVAAASAFASGGGEVSECWVLDTFSGGLGLACLLACLR